MYYYNRRGSILHSGLSKIFLASKFLAAFMFVAVGGSAMAATDAPATTGKHSESSIIAKCRADLAARLKLQAEDIKLIKSEATTWPNAALGMPEIGKVYIQSITPGTRVILEARNSHYLYATSAKAYKYGGPVNIWAYSLLYISPVKNDADMNGDLYQCSLLGTNATLLLSGVTDYYPQEKGIVVVKRRTSRSSHELLSVKADGSAKTKTLYSAMDFGEAAFSSSQNEWAGFVRPALGSGWSIVISSIDKDSKSARTLSLPDGTQPGRIAWSGDTLMILVQKSGKNTCFEISPNADKPEWRAVGTHVFPEHEDFMLNKSEWLEVNQVASDGKPGVEVVSAWFTGDRNVIAKINDFTLLKYDRLGRYVFISGDKDLKPSTYII